MSSKPKPEEDAKTDLIHVVFDPRKLSAAEIARAMNAIADAAHRKQRPPEE